MSFSERNYEKMDKFVNEMNQSVNIVGDMSIYLFNRFRNFVGYMFITITTVAIAFIVAEFVRGFALGDIMGVDVYYIALFSSLLGGLYLAFYGEEAKIATIKGAIFSYGSNRLWQSGAALAIIVVLILVNAKGVQKIADFSLRYMDSELQGSYILKLKETKMKNHAAVAKIDGGKSIGDTAVKMLMLSRDGLMRAKQNEIQAIQAASDSWIAGRDARAYRTIISQRRVKTAKDIAKIEEKFQAKIAKLDWKIQKAEEKVNSRLETANKLRTAEMAKADEATAELEKHYKTESSKNAEIVNMYKNIGIIVAVGGEVIDGLLAFLLFMIVKSNPNTNGSLKVQRDTRQSIRFKTYNTKDPIVVDRGEPSNSFSFKQPAQKESLRHG